MPIYKGNIYGKLIAKIEGTGTRSEGPEYYLIPEGKYKHWGEILLTKKVMMWQEDPILHKLVGKKVEIFAEFIETKDTISIDYIEVKKMERKILFLGCCRSF